MLQKYQSPLYPSPASLNGMLLFNYSIIKNQKIDTGIILLTRLQASTFYQFLRLFIQVCVCEWLYAILSHVQICVTTTTIKIQNKAMKFIVTPTPYNHTLYPYSLATTNLFSILIVLSIQECYINGIIQYVQPFEIAFFHSAVRLQDPSELFHVSEFTPFYCYSFVVCLFKSSCYSFLKILCPNPVSSVKLY